MSILQEAYFRICSGCHKEGEIVWKDGTKSLKIRSKEAGIQAISMFLDSEQVTIECALFLIRQIESSELEDAISEHDVRWLELSDQARFNRLMYYCKNGALLEADSIFPVRPMSHLEQ